MDLHVNYPRRFFVEEAGSITALDRVAMSWLQEEDIDVYFWDDDGANVRLTGSPSGIFNVRKTFSADEAAKDTSFVEMTDGSGNYFYRFAPLFSTATLSTTFSGSDLYSIEHVLEVEVTESGQRNPVRPIPCDVYNRVTRDDLTLTTLPGLGDLAYLDESDLTVAAGDTVTWQFSSATTKADPGLKTFRYDHATPASVTELYLDDEPTSTADLGSLLSALHPQDLIYIEDSSTPGNHQLFAVSGAVTDETGYWTIPVSHLTGSSLPAEGNACFFRFATGLDAIRHQDLGADEGLVRKTAAKTYTTLRTNLAATTDPTGNEDADDGYGIGSRWVNLTTDTEFVCLDATIGAAVWKETTGTNSSSGALTQTSVKSAAYTAAAGEHVLCDSDAAAGDFTITLPASPSAGDQVRVTLQEDHATRVVNLDGHGSDQIAADTGGAPGSYSLVLAGDTVLLEWVAGSVGWAVTDDGIQPHSARLYPSTHVTTNGAGATLTVDLDSVSWDHGAITDTTTHHRMEVRRAGRYAVDAGWASYNNFAQGDWAEVIGRANDVSTDQVADYAAQPNATAQTIRGGVSGILELAAGDYVELMVRVGPANGGINANLAHLALHELR